MFKFNKQLRKEAELDRFPCVRCGALLTFIPGTDHLKCAYCGEQNQIESRLEEIQEYDFHQTLVELAHAPQQSQIAQIHCEACGAHFKFAKSIHAGKCPFCGTDIVSGTASRKPITPKSLLPFAIDESEALQRYRMWLKSLWFAPNPLQKYARGDLRLIGVYLPYWTFDSDTQTQYTGARGDIYYVNQRVQTVQNGRSVSRLKRVPKIRWTPVRGRVVRFFDDVLVGASESLPRQILDRLQPWDLQNLRPYDENYLSGFSSEYYQVELDEGFDRAKQVMDNVIYQDIAFNIGGDQQRIHQVRTQHSKTTYKHCLLPVWSAAFPYRGKTYQFIINGRTGEVQGERPYSIWKIMLAVIAGLLLVSGIYLLMEHAGMLQEIQIHLSQT